MAFKNLSYSVVRWLFRNTGISSSYMVRGLGNINADWRTLHDNLSFQKAYETNVGVNSVINIKAEAKANVRFYLTDLDDNILLKENFTPEQANMYNLLTQPNPFQSTFEFWRQWDVFRSVFGNLYSYVSMPSGFENSDKINAYSMQNVWPQYTFVKYNKQIFDAITQADIINKYTFSYKKIKREFRPDEIIHRNDINIDFDPDKLTLGTSKLKALEKPISNIDIAFESRNVIGKRRGALGIFSGGSKDATGTFPMTKEDKSEAQKELDKYGTLEHQNQYILTRQPLTFQRTTLPIKDLMLFEEVATDIMHIATAYNVPEILVKAYVQGATFENQEASVRRLYQEAVIPETEDDVTALNNYFKCEAFGFKINSTFDHVTALQDDVKNKSETNKNQGQTYKELFYTGGCTYGHWQEAINMKPIEEIKDKFIFDLTPEQLAVIGANNNTQNIEQTA